MNSYARVASAIRDLRKAAGMSQEEAAERIGVSNATWSRWEAGKHVPTSHHLREVAEVFRINPDSFITRVTRAAEQSDIESRLADAQARERHEIGTFLVELRRDGSLVIDDRIVIQPGGSSGI